MSRERIEARLTIGRLAAASGVSAKTIRFYEAKGVLPHPKRTASRYRDYGEEDLNRLRFVPAARGARRRAGAQEPRR